MDSSKSAPIFHADVSFHRARSIARPGASPSDLLPIAAAVTLIAVRRLLTKGEGRFKMARLRSFYEADKVEEFGNPTSARTDENTHEVICGTCGETFFVDDKQAAHIEKAMKMTMENTFLCEGCQSEYEELSHRA